MKRRCLRCREAEATSKMTIRQPSGDRVLKLCGACVLIVMDNLKQAESEERQRRGLGG